MFIILSKVSQILCNSNCKFIVFLERQVFVFYTDEFGISSSIFRTTFTVQV